MTTTSQEHAMVRYIKKQRRTNHKDYKNFLFACFLSQIEPKKVIQAMTDQSWLEAMQDELLHFRLQKMDVKSAFLYGTIEEEVYVCQPPSFKDPYFPNKVYKVEKALYGLHQPPRAWYKTLSTYLLENRFRRGIIDKTLFIKKGKGDILIDAQEIPDEFYGGAHFLLKVVGLKTASTLIETNKALPKDEEAVDMDVHLYRLMIGSLMYLTASRPDIMFAVCACARFQVTPKVLNLHDVKRIFRDLKGQPKLGLWYPRDSPFDLKAFSNSDYARASLNRKSTTGGCQFLRKRLISWQCKKQTVVSNSTTEVEYVVVTNCCGELWATTKVKNVNGDAQIQALVDKKKVISTEASIRRYLRFEDEGEGEGEVDCLSNEFIFEQLTLIGSTMASAIISLTTNKKFNFSKYIFDNMVKHLDGGVKFLMYPRFVQVFLDNQIKDMDRHNAIFVISSHTKKVFANMKSEGKDFSGKVTYLFATMMVQAPKHMGEDSKLPTNSHYTPIVTQPSSFPPQKKQKSRRK
nr:hypothetical protein [Tanacetum cinerariifolium]